MLRACLIIALLAGLGALGVTHLVVGKKITEVTTQRDDFEKQKNDAQQAEAKAKGEARKAQDGEKKVAKERDELKSKYDVAAADVAVQRKRSAELETNLNRMTAERNEAQSEVAAWNALGVPVDQVKQMKADLAKTKEEKEAIVAERTIILRNLGIVEAELKRFKGDDVKVTLPAGLKGKVVSIDPKYDFVVLNVGSEQGAAEMGEMLVNRGGKLVAKVRLVRVQADRSIANILPEWKQADVVEGDLVLPSL